MIALCPSCRARIRIRVEQIVDQNLVRCSECWFVFVLAAEELRRFADLHAPPPVAPQSELSQRFADWQKRSSEIKPPSLDDVSLSASFDWRGLTAEDEQSAAGAGDSDIGEGTILSGFKEGADDVGEGELLFTLCVTEGPRAGCAIPVHRGDVVIGREGGDCPLGDPEVSRRHARLLARMRDGKRVFEIEDLGSTNGTIVNGTRIDRATLDNCDELFLGSTRLIFFIGRPTVFTPSGVPEARPSRPEEFDDGEGTRTLGAGNPFLPERLPRRMRAVIEVTEGPDSGLTVDFPRGALVIGREQADLRLTDPQVSRKHALVEILARDQIYVKDLASKNGTTVNGVQIKVARLQPGDSIQVGDTKLRFSAETFG